MTKQSNTKVKVFGNIKQNSFYFIVNSKVQNGTTPMPIDQIYYEQWKTLWQNGFYNYM